MGMSLSISIRLETSLLIDIIYFVTTSKCWKLWPQLNFVSKNITNIEQVSAYENYVTSLKFKISFLNSRTGDKMLVYDHGYGKKYRYHDSWGWVRQEAELTPNFDQNFSRAFAISLCQGSSSTMTPWPLSVRWHCLGMTWPSWDTLTTQRWSRRYSWNVCSWRICYILPF